MKLNEFVNNNNLKEIFDKLKQDLYYETAHLSSLQDIDNSESFKKILSHGIDIIPHLIEEIKLGEYLCSLSLCRICFKLIKPDRIYIPKSDSGDVRKIEKRLIDWWEENKFKYGK
jgi:hypothetical protein